MHQHRIRRKKFVTDQGNYSEDFFSFSSLLFLLLIPLNWNFFSLKHICVWDHSFSFSLKQHSFSHSFDCGSGRRKEKLPFIHPQIRLQQKKSEPGVRFFSSRNFSALLSSAENPFAKCLMKTAASWRRKREKISWKTEAIMNHLSYFSAFLRFKTITDEAFFIVFHVTSLWKLSVKAVYEARHRGSFILLSLSISDRSECRTIKASSSGNGKWVLNYKNNLHLSLLLAAATSSFCELDSQTSLHSPPSSFLVLKNVCVSRLFFFFPSLYFNYLFGCCQKHFSFLASVFVLKRTFLFFSIIDERVRRPDRM